MDSMAPASTSSPSPADACPCEILPCDTAASALRRKRIEIRRIRILANTADGLKRSRIHQLRDSNKKSREQQGPDDFQLAAAAADPPRQQLLEVLPQVIPAEQPSEPACVSAGRDACPAFGSISVCGRQREMEDAVAVEPLFSALPCALDGCLFCSGDSGAPSSSSSLHFFGVYDGHGGSQAATYCQQRLHAVLQAELQQLSTSAPPPDPAKFWEEAMTRCFLKVDEQVRRRVCSGDDCPACKGNGCDTHIPENVGSTAVVAVVTPTHLIIANCGDSRAVISRAGKAVPLSTDHKAGTPEETARVEAAGGRVILWDIPRIYGMLAVSRSIGDQYMTPYRIPNPEVRCITRSDSDECLILASDGLWDKVSNDAACEIARRCIAGRRSRHGASAVGGTSPPSGSSSGGASGASPLSSSPSPAVDQQQQQNQSQQQQQQQHHQEDDSPCSTAASMLLKVAYRNGSKDNISVVVVDLKRQRKREVASV